MQKCFSWTPGGQSESMFLFHGFTVVLVTCTWWVEMQHIYTVALQLTCRHVENVLCSSALWLLPAQYFSESGDGQQRKTLLGHEAAPGPSCTLPITRPLWADRAQADSWLLCYDMGEMGHCTSHHSVWIGVWLLSESAYSSGMTQDLWLCWLVAITSLFLLGGWKFFFLSSETVHIPLFIKYNSTEIHSYCDFTVWDIIYLYSQHIYKYYV